MARIAILTDSTANVPQEWIEQYHIETIPLKIHWGDKNYLDSVDITPGEFYQQLSTANSLPTTSQPSIEEFLQKYEELAEDSDGIIVPLISSGISGTVASAQAAARQFNRVPVEVIDTQITSVGQTLIILAAAQAIEQNKSLPEVKQAAEQVVHSLRVFFAVDTLEYLHKGGRINGASRYLGTALDIKPILYFNEEGKIDALERVRTKRKALDRLISLAQEQSNGLPIHAGVVHANALDAAQDFQKKVVQLLNVKRIFISEFSPVIGVHVGPGAIGLAFHTEEP